MAEAQAPYGAKVRLATREERFFEGILSPLTGLGAHPARSPRLTPWATLLPPLRGSARRVLQLLNLFSLLSSKNPPVVVEGRRVGFHPRPSRKSRETTSPAQ